MVHEREDSVMCGPVMPQGGIQALEAMLYTLDRLNNDDPKLLPDISVGAHILDDCDRDTYGLEMALDFIKGMYKFAAFKATKGHNKYLATNPVSFGGEQMHSSIIRGLGYETVCL